MPPRSASAKLNEQILAYGREAGVSYLEAYEATVKTFADYHEQAAGATGIEWMTPSPAPRPTSSAS